MRALFAKIREILRDRHLRRIWTRVISVMASVVVFISTYALILPAITMESEAACGIEAHQHTDECYEDVLTCGREESEDHQHTDACYTRTLICGKEAHIHSAECYKEDSSAVAVSGGTAVPAVTDGSAGDSSSDQSSGNHQTGQTSQPTQVDVSDASGPAADADGQGAGAEMSGTPENAGTTVTAEGLPADANTLSDGTGYVPVLDILNFDSLLTKETGFYYFHAEEGQPVPENSSAITDWKKLKNNITLASTDLVKAYLAYSIPAGALNETNQTARYRLPANIHLTDDQIQAINRTENGVAAAFAAAENGSGNESGNGNSESAADGSENTDSGITGAGEADAAAGYEKYLGAEAVEGTRTPDKTLRDGAQEYISATVRAENVYEDMLDENGNYIDFAGTKASPASDRTDLGDYIGQDLIITFTPYAVQKNQNTYDAEGNPLTAGEKVIGWFAVDFNMDQIDWVEEDTDLDKSTIEKSAEVIFALEDASVGSKERKTTLRLEEQAPAGENGTEDTADQDKAADENADLNKTDRDKSDSRDAEENAEKAEDAEAQKAADHTDGTLTADGDGYSITLAYTADAQIPENASLSVKEITPDTDSEAYEACLRQAAQKMGASVPESGNAGIDADANTGAAGDAADAAKAGAPALDTAASRFFDIEIVVTNDDGKTEKIEPKAPVAVNIQLSSAPNNSANVAAQTKSGSEKMVSGDKSEAESGSQTSDPTVLHFAEEGVETIESTVDSPATGNATTEQVEDTTAISFEAESFSIYGVVYTVDFEYSMDGKMYQFTLPGGEKITLSDLIEVLGIIGDTNNGEKAAFNSADSFLKEVANVEFSDESLVKVTPVEGDWELESLEPFTTKESLTITMKNGDVITIKVTDAQLSKDILTAKGETYSITVEYDDDAEIPENADLTVREISDGTKEFVRYLKEYSDELGVDRDAVTFARFFDIEIVKDGKKIEPKSPVRVTIAYKDALDINGEDHLAIIHFADEGMEVINETAISEDKKEITYEQDSFSVTGTIITNAPEDGKQYAVIVKKNNHYYSVRSDLSLELIDSAYDPANNTVNVDVKYPLLWNYTSVGNYHNLSIPSLGVEGTYWYGYAHDFYDRYFNVISDTGYVEETSSQANLREYSAIWYENNRLYGYIGNRKRYIGVSQDGTKLIGKVTNENDAAEIYFASLSKVEAPADNSTHDNHMVDHIDISITGETTVKLPLAYGDYYDSEGNKIFTSTAEHHVVSMTPAVDVTTDDIKKATIVATDKNTGEVLNDVFYITGYSQNEKTDEGGQKLPDQVRIEGSFKVSNIQNANDADNRQDIRESRRANPILYTVTVTKTVPVEATLEDGTKLYIKEGNSYVPLVVEVPLSLSSSFDYWDEGNECPPLHEGYDKNAPFKQDWKDGKILYDSGSGSLTGMDFQLIAFKEDDLHVTKPALEINKTIQKEDSEGNLSSLKTDDTHDVDVQVYYKEKGQSEEDDLIDVGCESAVESGALAQLTEGYNSIHHKTITVGKDAFGAAYDYDVSPDGGLFYIKEDPDSIDRYVTGRDGKTYQYVSSRVETEYVWRTDGDENKTHFANGVASVPEVLGAYSYEGTNLNNGFLVFDIYNVYKEVETVDVPVDKTWYSSEDSSVQLTDGYTWTSTFVLEEMEVHESGPVSSEANTTVWREVDGVSPITISNDDSESDRTFAGLPKYRYYDVDGEQSVYRIMYSVDETAYELKQNGTTISKWDKNNGLTEGDIQYVPHWPHDAGDANDESGIGPDDPDFYHVVVENHKKDEKVIETLSDLKLQKQWEDGALEEAGVAETHAYATFQLKRYVTREHVSYDTQYYDGTDATVRLIGQDGNTDTLIVKKGAKVKIIATFSNSGAVRYTIDGTSSQVEMSWYSGSREQKSADITVTGDLTIRANNYDWQQGQVSEDHLVLAAGAGSETAEDTEFSAEKHIYTLNRENGWIQVLGHLPLYSESAVVNGEQNLNHYSYYFTEIEMNPSGFYAEFTDGHGEPIGDSNHRVTEDDTTVKATNKKVPDFYVRKEWYNDLLPDYFPEVRVSLYQGVIQNGKVQRGSVYDPDGDGHFTDIPLNRDNNWTWKSDRYLPDTNSNGDPVGYYIVENSTGNAVNLYDEDGQLITVDNDHTVIRAKIGGGNSNGYYNSVNSDPKSNPWEAGLTENEGTLYVANQVSKNYTQFDVKKKIIEYVDDGTGNMRMDTTTSYPDRQKSRYLLMKVMRLTTSSPTYTKGNNSIVLHDWEDYGVPFVVGYDDDGNAYIDNHNTFNLDEGTSPWMWTIKEDAGNGDGSHSGGLPTVGFYLDPATGQYRQVYYYYLLEEIEAYSDKELTKPLVTDGYEWYVALEPEIWGASRTEIFPKETGQDQDRIMNIQASNLIVEKDWTQDTDVQEVYVKIYRTPKSSQNIDNTPGMDDVTWEIAARTYQYPDYGVVPASNISDPTFKAGNDSLHKGGVLILRPDDGPITVSQILFRDPNNNAEFHYYIEEVGYKDKYGVVRSIEEKFVPQYDYWDRAESQWAENWVDNATDNSITIGTRNNNKLRVRNVPTLSIETKKEWYDADGNKLEGPWDGIMPTLDSSPVTFNIIQKMQQYVDGDPVGNITSRTLLFNGSEDLTIDGTSNLLQAIVSQSGSYRYTYTTEDAPAGTAAWTTIVDGLQKHYIDAEGKEYRFTYEIKEKSAYNNCVSSIVNGTDISGNATCVIKNEKTVTSLAIEKTFGGSVELTEEQKQKITFTVTGKFDGTNEMSRVFTYGKDGITVNGAQQQTGVYKWNDGILVIKGIQTGTYTVVEQNDDVGSIFEGDTSGKTYTHTSTCTVTNGTVTDGTASAIVEDGDRTTVRFINTYDEGPTTISVTLKKVDEKNINKTPLEASDLLDGAKLILEKYTQVTPVESKDTVWNEAHNDLNAGTGGVFTFTDLPVGFYKIVEKEYPKGYVHVTTDPVFEVAVDENTGNLKIQIVNDADGLVKLDEDGLTIIVGNTPGTALPSTGGPGTRLFTLLGAALIAGSGLLLWRRRRLF